MNNRPWQISFAAVVMVGLAGCQLPARNLAESQQPDAEAVVAGSTSADSMAESLRIRAEWKKRALASVYGQKSLVPQHSDPRDSSATSIADLSKPAVAHDSEDPESSRIIDDFVPVVLASSAQVIDEPVAPPAVPGVSAQEAFPVDLPTILRLAGGRNWAVQLAWERINQAQANVTAAEAMWIPNLNIGIGATKHEGRIQGTNGQIIDVSRNSLFVGGGAKVGNAPMAGGAGGPARLAVDLSIADALFQPLVARQLSCAAQSRHAVEFNDAQLAGALAYFDLVAAQGEISIIRQNLTDAQNLLSMTESFVAAGKASATEVSRVQVIVATHQQALVEAELKLRLASTELIRIVRLDPSQLSAESLIYSADDHLLAIELIPETSNLDSLIVQGQSSRPEVGEQHAMAQARMASARSEELRPYIPNLNLGVSAGGFGGGVGSDIDGLNGRADFDALLVWEVRNLGFGENAARCESCSRYRQAVLRSHQVQDQIAAEVRNGWHRVEAGRQRINIARNNVNDAATVLESNLARIRGLEGLPLEAIQALEAVSSTRLSFLRATVDYNKAQAELLRAVGRPIASGL